MKVTSLHVSNLFSFADFSLSFQNGLTVIVGPNGAGKSNIVRALDAVVKLLEWADDQSRRPGTVPRVPVGSVVSSYAQASHDGSPADTPIELRLGIQLTTGPERERVVSFFRAALLATLCQESAQATDDTLKGALSSWVLREIDETKLTALFTGTLIFRHAGYETALWEARYEFCHDGRRYDWLLYSFSSWDSIIPQAQDAAAEPAASSTRLCQILFDQPTTPLPLPDPMPSFDLAKLCLLPGERLAGLNVSMGTGVFNDRYEPFRNVARVLELPQTTGQTSYGFARALRLCVDEGVVVLGEQFRGLGIGGAVPWRAGVYPWETLTAAVPPRDPGFLPLRLFDLKNGSSAEDREAFAAIQEQFERLTPGRSFDVTFAGVAMPVTTAVPLGAGQVAVPAAGDENGSEDRPGAVISVVAWRRPPDGQPRRERPIQLHGAGTWEALVLAEALVGSTDRLTVLDEPAINFHPGWQMALRDALREAPGQFLLVTHSSGLIPMETDHDLRRLVRVSNEAGASCPHLLPEKLTARTSARITRTFALSADARALLLSRGAVLVSGGTELGALPTWWGKSPAAVSLGTPADRDLAFLSVEGDGGFANVLTVLHELSIPWVLICDGKSFDVEINWGSHVFRQITTAGIDIPDLATFVDRVNHGRTAKRTMTQELWDEQLAVGASHGIFTVATSWAGEEECIEGLFKRLVPEKVTEAGKLFSESKIRKARWIAQETPCPPEIDALYRQVVAALGGSPP